MDRTRWAALLARPALVVVGAFSLVIAFGTALLVLPVSAENGRASSVVTAVFTATGAMSGGLSVVDTGSHWNTFGEVVVLGLIQLGGFGIMTFASLLGLLVLGRIRLGLQLTAQAETGSLGIGDVRRVLLGVARITVVVELAVAAWLMLRFRFAHGQPIGEAAYYGLFHAVSAFNNAGFGLRPDNLVGYASDIWVMLPIAVACILGSIGFPVLLELLRSGRSGAFVRSARHWSLHTRLTLLTTAVLLVVGSVFTWLLEWSNPGTLGPLTWPDKLSNGFFNAVTARTAGFNSVDVGEMKPATLLVTTVLMFIGGGSASTAGGIKVTTFAVLGTAILAEVRGNTAVEVMGRRITSSVLRQALTVALLGVGAVIVSTMVLLTISDEPLLAVLFEATSAFGTCGLTTGITGDLPEAGQLILVALMFIGRIGPITVASALALRVRGRLYQLPEERPVIG
ncbi:TrkH family potassium uptake protein [Streptomyces sp. ISL-98]|nr:potassium transporter TrkG [Streptomyces sp. ISL-98]MBT2510794.1 TrkH family potassium uptake protein [Streptomyces sp. ISL-98]